MNLLTVASKKGVSLREFRPNSDSNTDNCSLRPNLRRKHSSDQVTELCRPKVAFRLLQLPVELANLVVDKFTLEDLWSLLQCSARLRSHFVASYLERVGAYRIVGKNGAKITLRGLRQQPLGDVLMYLPRQRYLNVEVDLSALVRIPMSFFSLREVRRLSIWMNPDDQAVKTLSDVVPHITSIFHSIGKCINDVAFLSSPAVGNCPSTFRTPNPPAHGRIPVVGPCEGSARTLNPCLAVSVDWLTIPSFDKIGFLFQQTTFRMLFIEDIEKQDQCDEALQLFDLPNLTSLHLDINPLVPIMPCSTFLRHHWDLLSKFEVTATSIDELGPSRIQELSIPPVPTLRITSHPQSLLLTAPQALKCLDLRPVNILCPSLGKRYCEEFCRHLEWVIHCLGTGAGFRDLDLRLGLPPKMTEHLNKRVDGCECAEQSLHVKVHGIMSLTLYADAISSKVMPQILRYACGVQNISKLTLEFGKWFDELDASQAHASLARRIAGLIPSLHNLSFSRDHKT